MSDRYQPYRQVATAHDLDAVVLVPGANFERLFGHPFHQNERPLLIMIPVQGPPSAVVPNLELGSFAALDFEGTVFDWRDQDGYQGAFDALFEAHPVDHVGVEGQGMRVFVQQAMQRARPSLACMDAQQAISGTRLIKTADELTILRRAIAITETALAETLASVRIGQSETDIRNRLVQRLFAGGAESFSFAPVVAAADNAARPHAHSRESYAVQAGDVLLIDCGARYQGLCADITRTVFVGHCSDEHSRVYQTVLDANLAGLAAVAPGNTAHQVDDAATAVLEASAFAEHVQHKTGHGLGRDVHEDPYIMRGNKQVLGEGMVFTVEPGLYKPGALGVRIEDDVLVTADGGESLTTLDKSLSIVGG